MINGLLESIIQNALLLKTKTKQIQKAKQDIREAFHVEGKDPDGYTGLTCQWERILQWNS